MQAREMVNRLTDRTEDVARYLLPNGKQVGNNWQTGDVNDNKGQSLKVCLVGEKRGIFIDFATGEGGDLLTLWGLTRKISISDAMKEAGRYLGINTNEKRSPRLNLAASSALSCNALEYNSHLVKNYLVTERKLLPEVIQKFRVTGKDDEIIFPFFYGSELLNIKYLKIERPNGKKILRTEKNAQHCLFGWQAADLEVKEIVITEGEIDAMSLHQYGYNAFSVPYGAGVGSKNQWIEFEFENLKQFNVIYLCFDNDEPGQQAAIEISKRLGVHRCRIVNLPYKDANECLQKGVSHEVMQRCFAEAKTFDPAELKQASDFHDAIIKRFYPGDQIVLGISAPWEKARDKILFRPSELSVWTGINGHGKSQFLGQIMLGAMHQGHKVCVASLELKPAVLLKRLTQQAAGLANPSEQYIKAIVEWYQHKLWVFDVVGTTKTDRLMEVFLYARQRYGVDMFVIDSFLRCGIGEEDYTNQKKFIEQLCDFKNDHDCHVHLIVHPRKGMDESRSPGKLDVKGTGSVTDLADNCFIVWRNKPKEEEIRLKQAKGEDFSEALKKPDCLWICDKQRNGDWEGKLAFWFDRASYQYLETHYQKPQQFVSYSQSKNNFDV